jgi:hypothetical protein
MNCIVQTIVPSDEDGAFTVNTLEDKLHSHFVQETVFALTSPDQHNPSVAQNISITFQIVCVLVEVIVVG